MAVLNNTKLYEISELNRLVKRCLQYEFGQVDVLGEVSNYTKARSGHAYFSLKDAHAQVSCAYFSSLNSCQIDNGMMVRARASVGLYETRGQYQLIIQHIEPYGEGQLRRAYELLRKRLESEGLFDPIHKRPLPHIPSVIGLITSDKAAALADVEKVLHDRFPYARRILYVAQVQGMGAEASIRAALSSAISHQCADVLLIIRGGGSLEDLWAFNDEQLARDIAACPIPCVTGVGHEIDTTIVDFVADKAAPTPTAAAIAVTPDRHDLIRSLSQIKHRLARALRQKWQQSTWQLDQLKMRCLDPARLIERQYENLVRRVELLQQRLRIRHLQYQHQLALSYRVLHTRSPQSLIEHGYQTCRALKQRYHATVRAKLTLLTQHVNQQRKTMNCLSPQTILKKGYAVITDPTGQVLTDPHIDNPEIMIQWAHVKAKATLTEVQHLSDP